MYNKDTESKQLRNKIMTVEMKKFEVTYHKDDKFDAEYTQTFLHLVTGYEYQDAMDEFQALNLGTLWSIDEINMHQAEFSTLTAAEKFLKIIDKHGIGEIEEKGRYTFVAHYPCIH